MKTKHLLFAIIPLVMAGCGLFKSADNLYKEAEIKRNGGEVQAALELLQRIVNQHTDHKKAPEAQYLIAEIYYRDMRDYSEAIKQYDKVKNNFPDSKQVPFSIFMQGFIFANMLADFKQAEIHYSKFIKKYPDHELYQSVEFELKYLGKEIKDIPALKHITS